MRFIVRVLLFLVGVTLAISAGTVFLMIAAVFDPVVGELAATMAFLTIFDGLSAVEDPEEMVVLLAGLWGFATSVLVVPPALVALIGEIARVRSFIWYLGGTGALTAALPWLARGAIDAATASEMRVTLVLFLTGIVAGFVYWAVAGHSAGPREPRPLTGPASPGS